MTKSAHFIPVQSSFSVERLARIYNREVVRLYGVPTNGQSERTIQVLEDMLRAYVLEFGAHWDQLLHLVVFGCNNNYHSSIQMALFEALYGRRYRFLVGWIESTKPRPWGTYLIREALDQVRVIQDILRTTQTRHQSYAYQRRRPLRLSVGDRVLLCVSPLKDVMRFGKQGKLRPRHRPVDEATWETEQEM
ncbi:uncharacterized protein LOC125863899 [Solanum stenotomum]|uniref:uncharacterized protein LOC125863899 n=1 Tax=Solanum stenotomum TaxID=172797 RepID=UPI0020D1A204|nr:uncharacterized protein LOC125863899 [Solanum stenotomum]